MLLGVALAFTAGWFWRRWRKAQKKAQHRGAQLDFSEQREALQQAFLAAASATGKPRGLRWKQCDLNETRLFAQDRANGELVAFVGITVSFEAIAGGAMEEVEAVGNLRFATAIFVHRQGKWTTDGRVVFNLEPAEALARFQESLAAVE